MDGSDNMKPLIISKFKTPRGLRGNILPCDYDYNKKARMTSAVFMRWLRCFEVKLGTANGKVILFVNNCPAYPELYNLRNIELVFLPKNTISILQPLDQGIFQQRSSPVGGQCSKKTIVNCFRDIHFVTPVKEEAAIHVFLAAASSKDPDDPPPVDGESQNLAPQQCLHCTFEEFVTADDDIAVWGTFDYVNYVQGQQESSDEKMGRVKQKNLFKLP
ncbi:hypothetical protein PR048_012632 [Dryococelus australis]|uniref:DDE-1 domain-containing protein n=1 Tax=Dryococelus australis TaxID=614101 RepID=A0ABQ9HQ22_9NEOP|nr:hypothetical protein PR048_012632 [Dryococelus australis]